MNCRVQSYTAPYCTDLHCILMLSQCIYFLLLFILWYYYTALDSTSPTCPALKSSCLQFTGVQLHSTLHTAIHCTAKHCTALHCTALHCTALPCTAQCLTQLATEFGYSGSFFCQVQLFPANYSSKFKDRLPSEKKTSFN